MELNDFLDEFKAWDSLSERQRSFFWDDDYLPLPKLHAERISTLSGIRAVEFIRLALYNVPTYSIAASCDFKHKDHVLLHDVWNDKKKIAEVRDWLYKKGIPFSNRVYLLYDDLVVLTDWKILVTYWDALAWSVGFEMIALDSTKSWICCFHHEEVITFMSF